MPCGLWPPSWALQDLCDTADAQEPELVNIKREQVLRKIKRLSPARSAAISATTTLQGEVVAESADIAAASRTHWAPTHTGEPIHQSLLRRWLQEDTADSGGLQRAFAPLVQNPRDWKGHS